MFSSEQKNTLYTVYLSSRRQVQKLRFGRVIGPRGNDEITRPLLRYPLRGYRYQRNREFPARDTVALHSSRARDERD